MKPMFRPHRLHSDDGSHASYREFPAAHELSNGLEVGAIAQKLLGKRSRAEFLMGEPILPADMIEVTARRLRVLDRDDDMEREFYPPRHAPQCERAGLPYGGARSMAAPAPEHEEEPQEPEELLSDAELDEEEPLARRPGPARPMMSVTHTSYSEPAFDYDDPSDGFSSGVPSPESVMSLVADFPGSPLNLDEDGADHVLSAFVCSPTRPTLSTKEGFIFDNLEESAWMSESFATW